MEHDEALSKILTIQLNDAGYETKKIKDINTLKFEMQVKAPAALILDVEAIDNPLSFANSKNSIVSVCQSFALPIAMILRHA